MFVGVVIGNVWATKKEDALNGLKLMVVQRIEPSSDKRLESLVAADCVGAGIGEQVLVVTGSSARMALSSSTIPVDAAIIGILDEVEIVDRSGDK
jgi:ethanolamine utilization protein EutN